MFDMNEDKPAWADELIEKIGNMDKKIDNLETEIKGNCTKLNSIQKDTEILPDMYEMVQANGNNREELVKTVNNIENKIDKLISKSN